MRVMTVSHGLPGPLTFDRAPDWDVLLARVDRISRLMPSLRQRVIDSPIPVIAPRWTYDPHFDLNWHLRRVRVPEPRTRDAALQLARWPAMDTFDRARPLWELTLVEGLEHGGAALIAKVHHSLSDGVSGMHLLAVMADPKRKPRRLGEMPPVPPGTFAMARSVYRTAGPSSGAMSPLMRERATARHLAVMEVSLETLKTAAKAADGTVNDAYLAVVTGGLRRYHEHHGTSAEFLRAVIRRP